MVARPLCRRVSLISVSELDIDLFYHHFSKPKDIYSLSSRARFAPLQKSSWSSQLITSTKNEPIYDQQPWYVYNWIVCPISFVSSGWLKTCMTRIIFLWIAITNLCRNRHISRGFPLRSVSRTSSWLLLREKKAETISCCSPMEKSVAADPAGHD